MSGDTLHTGLEGKSPKEKTAMMEAIENFETIMLVCYTNGEYEKAGIMEKMVNRLTELLATERMQMGECVDAIMNHNDFEYFDEYYESKYGETPELLTPKTQTNG